MQLRKYQGGLGALGWLVVLAIASFGLTCFFKIGPLYLEYWQTKKAIEVVLNNSVIAAKSKPEIAAAIEKQFDVSRIESIKPSDIKLNESRNGRELDASYEKRVALIANLDVVVKFDQLKYNLSAVK
jgi:hypothetical protein